MDIYKVCVLCLDSHRQKNVFCKFSVILQNRKQTMLYANHHIYRLHLVNNTFIKVPSVLL